LSFVLTYFSNNFLLSSGLAATATPEVQEAPILSVGNYPSHQVTLVSPCNNLFCLPWSLRQIKLLNNCFTIINYMFDQSRKRPIILRRKTIKVSKTVPKSLPTCSPQGWTCPS